MSTTPPEPHTEDEPADHTQAEPDDRPQVESADRARAEAADQPLAESTDQPQAETAVTPAERPRGRRGHRRAVDPGRGPEPVWHRSAWEDDPRAWGDSREDPEQDSDQRILREKPPHW